MLLRGGLEEAGKLRVNKNPDKHPTSEWPSAQPLLTPHKLPFRHPVPGSQITGAYYDFSQCWCSFKKSYLDCSILGLPKLTSLLRAFTTAQCSCVLVCLMAL